MHRHRRARVGARNTIENMEHTGTWWVPQVARVMEEQLREEQQELEMREQKKKAKDAKRTRGIDHENDKSKGTRHVQEMVKLMHHEEQELLSLWEGWHWDDNKGGCLDPGMCAKATREDVEYSRRNKMYTRVPREVCLRETEKAPIKTGWARGGSRRNTRRTRGGSCTRRRRHWRR